MSAMLRRILPAVLLALVAAAPCAAGSGMEEVYTLYSLEGEALTQRAGSMYEGDEYIAGDNRHFRVVRTDPEGRAAYAEYIGMSEVSDSVEAATAAAAAIAEEGRGLICMYSTHSDECYVEGDGTSSKWSDAGIYDVGGRFKEELEKLGYEVIYSDDTFLPHDTGAYARSAATAEELVRKSPDALFDIHRDGVPAEQYESSVEGEDVSMVRLFVGRSNANRDANMAFAKQIKAEADDRYPGLIKDIYMGKGNYNQELYPQALLLEFGTHEIDKDLVMKSTGYMAEVVDNVLGGGAAAEERSEAGGAGAGRGILWVVLIVVAAALIYGFAATGRFHGAWDRIRRSVGELTGRRSGKRR